MGTVIINIPEALTATETKRMQPDVAGRSPVAPVVLAVEVERVHMLAAPVQDDLQDGWSCARVVSLQTRSRRQMSGLISRRVIRS